MIIYKVFLDISLVISRLKRFNLGKYNSAYPIVFIEAINPDDACYKATYKLINKILSQDDSVETSLLCKDIINDIKVVKVIVP